MHNAHTDIPYKLSALHTHTQTQHAHGTPFIHRNFGIEPILNRFSSFFLFLHFLSLLHCIQFSSIDNLPVIVCVFSYTFFISVQSKWVGGSLRKPHYLLSAICMHVNCQRDSTTAHTLDRHHVNWNNGEKKKKKSTKEHLKRRSTVRPMYDMHSVGYTRINFSVYFFSFFFSFVLVCLVSRVPVRNGIENDHFTYSYV